MNEIKMLLHENPLLNETDLEEDDDPVSERIPHQKSNNFNHPMLSTFS